MPVIRHDEAESMAREAIVLDLGDLQRHAELLRKRAEEQAEAIVVEAREERRKLLDGAEKEGYAKGFAEGKEVGLQDGRKEGHAEAAKQTLADGASVCASLSEALGGFEATREILMSDARQDLVALAIAIAQRVLHKAVEHDAEAAIAQLEAALSTVLEPTRLIIRMNPGDVSTGEEILGDLMQKYHLSAHAEIMGDEQVSRGSCLVRTDRGQIDAVIEHQLARVAEALVPGLHDESKEAE
ncbi:MAG: FliH/SctL family protein [Planctomycetota bacterium]